MAASPRASTQPIVYGDRSRIEAYGPTPRKRASTSSVTWAAPTRARKTPSMIMIRCRIPTE